MASECLLLGLDGVLMDTRPVLATAWYAVQEAHGITVPFADYLPCVGRPFADIMGRLGIGDADQVEATYSTVCRATAHLARPFEGVADALCALVAGGWRVGVVTSTPLNRAEPLLAPFGDVFAAVRTTDGFERGKPAPDPLLLALVDLAVDPAEATYAGGTEVDLETARRAGVPYVHAGWGYGQPDESEPKVAHDPAELLWLLSDGHGRGPFVEGSVL
ncbi:HAD family hydrolase [Streptomyces niveiscabiei]|uniref:HAD family hydrolase n=1 Tax=Streptomyces niveiscabiei TaxID=164115 RepID=A0ABW9I622_9ACTN